MKRLLPILLLMAMTGRVCADFSNPECYYNFEAGTGNPADQSGHSHTGTLNGGATYATGKIGSFAIQGNGSNGYISSSIAAANSATSVTIAGWMFRSAAGHLTTYGFATGTGNHVCSLDWFTDNQIFFSIGDGTSGWFPHTAAITSTGWHHVACVFDAAASPKMKVYFDGADQSLTGTITTQSALSSTTGNSFFTLRDNNGFTTSGDRADDVRVYVRALSASEVAQLAAFTGHINPSIFLQSSLKPCTRFFLPKPNQFAMSP